jgi:hypothetical protein
VKPPVVIDGRLLHGLFEEQTKAVGLFMIRTQVAQIPNPLE